MHLKLMLKKDAKCISFVGKILETNVQSRSVYAFTFYISFLYYLLYHLCISITFG